MALTDFNKCIKLAPGYAHPYNGRALAYQAKLEYDKAMADYNHAIRLDPKNPYLYANRGTLWLAKGEFDIALADVNEALRIDPAFTAPTAAAARRSDAGELCEMMAMIRSSPPAACGLHAFA